MSRPPLWLRLAGWGLAIALVALAIWWACTVPYRPGAVYDAIPDGVLLVTRHLDAGARWSEFVRNPFAQSLLGTAGVPIRDVLAAADDPETCTWVTKLTGHEAVLAFLPEANGHRAAWLGAAWLGGGAQRLRWQLEVFHPAGYRWLGRAFGCPIWEVTGADVGPGNHLVIAFAEGILLASISQDLLVVESMLLALDRPSTRLRAANASFRRFVALDDQAAPDLVWGRPPAPPAPAANALGTPSADAPWALDGFFLELSDFSGTRTAGRAELEGSWPGNATFPAAADHPSGGLPAVETILGATPCAVAVATRDAIDWLARTPRLAGDFRHALRMVTEVASDRLLLACLDGDLSGRLSFGMMKSIGLRGIRVPTLVAATPAPQGEAPARVRLQAILDSCNARYRAAFIMRPAGTAAGIELWSLESAGGDEWVDFLALEDRPACAFFGDWLLVASNLDALRALATGKGAQATVALVARPGIDTAPRPAWAMAAEAQTAPVWLWLDIDRAGKATLDALAMVSMLQRWAPSLDASSRAAVQDTIASTRAWVQSLLPFREATASLERLGPNFFASATLGPP
ncbi:MAG: hypothetical protein IJT88_09055 [Kiritimatiellae bacterium]|nr:hypothetical protein [Kiritimatiellia bacterium]